MPTTIWGVVQGGKVELSGELPVPEGTRVLVTALTTDEEGTFWLQASQPALAQVWDNAADDTYAQLLEK